LCLALLMTTFCSGVGTAESAVNDIRRAFATLGIAVRIDVEFSCDAAASCRAYLLRHRLGNHVFGNMCDLVQVPQWDHAWSYLAKWHVIFSSLPNDMMFCFRCGVYHVIGGGDLDVSGTPCQDHSRVGSRLGIDGPRIHIWLVYCHYHRRRQTAILIHENVWGFPEGTRTDSEYPTINLCLLVFSVF
jgi:site-specific DNA-cytosine methylase